MRPSHFQARIAAVAALGLSLSLAFAGCTSATGAAATPTPGVRVAAPAGETQGGAPGGVDASAVEGTGLSSGSGVSSGGGVSSPAMVYPMPIYPGAAGLAPDHTIVVTGSGTATIKTDMSDRTAAERRAINAALADARNQAEAVAAATGVHLGVVLSVSVATGGPFILPMGAATPSVPNAASGSPAIKIPVPAGPTSSELSVSVTVEYAIG